MTTIKPLQNSGHSGYKLGLLNKKIRLNCLSKWLKSQVPQGHHHSATWLRVSGLHRCITQTGNWGEQNSSNRTTHNTRCCGAISGSRRFWNSVSLSISLFCSMIEFWEEQWRKVNHCSIAYTNTAVIQCWMEISCWGHPYQNGSTQTENNKRLQHESSSRLLTILLKALQVLASEFQLLSANRYASGSNPIWALLHVIPHPSLPSFPVTSVLLSI